MVKRVVPGGTQAAERTAATKEEAAARGPGSAAAVAAAAAAGRAIQVARVVHSAVTVTAMLVATKGAQASLAVAAARA